jgi:hypothetical protein
MRGSRPGERRGGRQRGTKNKRTLLRERAQAEAAVKIADVLGADAFDGDAHALLASVYRDAALPIELRVDAAKAAIGFERPRLASIDGRFDGALTLAALVEQSMRQIEAKTIEHEPSPGKDKPSE